jgi:hypothetical protein
MEHLKLDFAAAFREAAERGARRFEQNSREWTRMLDAAVNRIQEVCPTRNQTGEPSAEDVQTFVNEMMAVLRAGSASGDDEDFIDALLISIDYCPTDPRQFDSVAGVEERAFLALGPRARLTAVRGLSRLGENDLLRGRILALSQSPTGASRVPMLVAVMGGMRHNDFFPYLKQARRQAKKPGQIAAITEALSRIPNPEAADLILADLERSMKRVVDTGEHRAIKLQLTGLGRIVRLRGMDAEQRARIVNEAIGLVGERDWGISSFAAESLLAVGAQDLDPEARLWGVRQIMRALFSRGRADRRAGDDRSPLGFRAPLVAILQRMGPAMLEPMLESAASHAADYSGAHMAFAEVLSKIGDKRALPILEQMTHAAFHHRDDEDEPGDPLREKVFNPETEEMEDLKRDDVVHSLLHALREVGGEKGRQLVLGFADRVQAGQLRSPGGKTASFLVQAKRESGSLGQRETPVEDEDAARAEKVSEEEFQRALGQARGKLFGKGRKQIEALATLGRSDRPEAAGVMVACLHDKNAAVAAAAEIALAQFVSPPPPPSIYERALMEVFSDARLLREPALSRWIEVVERCFPKIAPYDKLYRKAVSIELGDGELSNRLLGAIRPKAAQGKNAAEMEEAEEDDPIGEKARAKQELLRAKQLYFRKRQAWIRGGKRGPEPIPPPEIAGVRSLEP